MWTYTAELAIQAELAKIDEALAELDAGNYEQARSLVREVLHGGALPRSEFGGPLFVLGAVKAHDATTDPIPERRRIEYLVASRYLRESQAYGFVPGREKQGLLLLGMSLVNNLQVSQGIRVLEQALEAAPSSGGAQNAAIHRLLAEAYTMLRTPNFPRALAEIEVVLADDQIAIDERVPSQLLRAKILGGLNRYDEARQVFQSLPSEVRRESQVQLAYGKLLLDGVEAKLAVLPLRQDGKLPQELDDRVNEALAELGEAQSRDAADSTVVRRAVYLMAWAAELRGDTSQALRLYAETREQYGDTYEGLAAKLAEADIRRSQHNDEEAIILYRQVLQGDLNPATYRSDILSTAQLRQRIMAAVNDFVERGMFDNAVVLLDRFSPLFTRTQELALRGQTLRDWGERQIREASGDTQEDAASRRVGRKRLREAGVAFERLAELRFATRQYSDDLWESAECYFNGQSYTNAARVLDIYLKTEPEDRNARALLMLGQANLALGNTRDCIATLEECIELYARDNAIYQARIDCARAYLLEGNAEKAENLLRFNLTQSTLKPQSPEWKDSLFALGRLLVSLDRHEDAISTLEEAVERYPNDAQTLLARYLIGESYRRWADEPLERLLTARTTGEREKNQQLVDDRLAKALANLKDVQSRITLQVHNAQDDPVYGAMRRNCYMLEGAVLFDLGRYKQAIEAYQNVSSLFPNESFVLDTFLQIAHCWQRMNRPKNARGAVEQARLTLEELPSDADFLATTAFTRDEWRLLLNDMAKW